MKQLYMNWTETEEIKSEEWYAEIYKGPKIHTHLF